MYNTLYKNYTTPNVYVLQFQNEVLSSAFQKKKDEVSYPKPLQFAIIAKKKQLL